MQASQPCLDLPVEMTVTLLLLIFILPPPLSQDTMFYYALYLVLDA